MDKILIKEVKINMVEMPKIRVYVTIREDFVKWIDEQVQKLKFANRSHAIEYAISKLIETEKKE
ncbi:MAG: ribbon-helix-helix domain-containing protein [Candidatus Bathyarchaeia archaeon]